MIDEKKQKERQRWHERMKNPEFREAERQRSIARHKEYMKDPEFRAKWNAYRRRRYAKLKAKEMKNDN